MFFFKCDLRDLNSVRSVFKEIYSFHKNVDAVIHFAGLKSVSESVSNPLIYWDVNFNGTRNLLEIMDKHNCKNLFLVVVPLFMEFQKESLFLKKMR